MTDPQVSVWEPNQYLKFDEQRSLPYYDLRSMVQAAPSMRILDLGCGTGALTRDLHTHLKAAETIGIDSSPEMLAKAQEESATGLEFRQEDIQNFSSSKGFGLVFSNAALQWVPDHPHLFAQIRKLLRYGGQVAVQMPMNYDSIAHLTAAELGERDPYNIPRLKRPVLAPEDYSRMLFDLGFVAQSVQVKVYAHVLDSTHSVFEWVKGSLLSHYRRALTVELYQRFETDYLQLLLKRAGDHKPYFYPFKRVLIWAQLAG